ncbi:hypothetical protein AZ78_4367 [Lysobacter capsici AZ78]|uniref:Uncharacterized protein n=1 Tax=Lysobacter capsici AZ78 TaxID=1444315 RepID=A0A108UCT3_9GAMM|nr:hypothetical protein AZ78_4367 [Lysobacter capsici AZ78]
MAENAVQQLECGGRHEASLTGPVRGPVGYRRRGWSAIAASGIRGSACAGVGMCRGLGLAGGLQARARSAGRQRRRRSARALAG